MGLFFRKTLERSVFQLGVGTFILGALLAHKDVPICYRFSHEPLPNQRFVRAIFLMCGVALVVGGVWGLWNEWLLR
jgi:hypothetical protein